METLTFGEIPAGLEIDEHYEIHLKSQSDLSIFARAINQGIDSHLEAVRTKEHETGRFDVLDSASMRCLLRRLAEDDDEEAQDFASCIMQTLGYEWI